MTTIVTRAGKGSPLTHTEVDTNFTNLNTNKLETAAIPLGTAAAPSVSFVSDANTGIFSPGADQVAISTNGTERARIDSSGRTGFGVPPNVFGDDARITIQGTGVTRSIYSNINGTSSSTHITLANGNGAVGSITTNASATAYNTSSDYRLKENVTAVTDGINRLQQLNPRRFNFIVDPNHTVDGFIAHEVQDVVPEAIHGTKDEVDADGNPVHQGIDQSKLVPLLTAALQEAIAKIESFEARLTAAGI